MFNGVNLWKSLDTSIKCATNLKVLKIEFVRGMATIVHAKHIFYAF